MLAQNLYVMNIIGYLNKLHNLNNKQTWDSSHIYSLRLVSKAFFEKLQDKIRKIQRNNSDQHRYRRLIKKTFR
jgi:hypothetical protein